VGLRPQLRGRPSFYDLIKQRGIDQLSIATAKFVEELPAVAASSVPLPASPHKANTPSLSSPTVYDITSVAKRNLNVNMAPVSSPTLKSGVTF